MVGALTEVSVRWKWGGCTNKSLKGRMTESTVLNHGKWRLIGSKKADQKMIGLEGVMQRTKSSLTPRKAG